MKNVLLLKLVMVAMLISGVVACGDAGDSVDVEIPKAPVASTPPEVTVPTPPPTDGPMTQEEMVEFVASLPNGTLEALAELGKSKQKTRPPVIIQIPVKPVCPEGEMLPAYDCTSATIEE
ncbi:MAG: hypothetical protein HYU97_03705 [Deltaproteobacteria bacterium]|nr:hypothetical protein [Deltaproteobacteria bacterium]